MQHIISSRELLHIVSAQMNIWKYTMFIFNFIAWNISPTFNICRYIFLRKLYGFNFHMISILFKKLSYIIIW